MAPGAGHGVSLAASADGRVVADAIRLVAVSGPPADIVYIHPDQLGAPQKMTDAVRAVVWDRQAGPFGELETIAGLAAMPLRFPGQYADAESSFNYNYFRDYDPALGRYIESDPIGLLGGLNTYAYVEGNPVIYGDPTGECPWCIIPAALVARCATGAAIGAALGGVIDAALQYREKGCVNYGDVFEAMVWGAAIGCFGDLALPLMVGRFVPRLAQFAAGALERFADETGAVVLRGMNNPIVRASVFRGQQAHRALKQQVLSKPGWRYAPRVRGRNGSNFYPDVVTPRRYFIELKPNTVTGRLAGRIKLWLYQSQLQMRGRIIYYDP